MKKFIIRLVVTLVSLSLLLFTSFLFLLGTERGAQFTIAQLERILDDSLQVGSTKGRILDRLELRDILFTNNSGITKVASLVLDWKSTDLLKLHFHILEFSAATVSHTVLPQANTTQPEKKGSLLLPELTLPITVSIDKLSLRNFTFFSNADSKSIQLHEAEFSLLWDTGGIHLHKLSADLDEASLQASGNLNPVGSYPFELKTVIKTLASDLPSLTIKGEYSGELQKTIHMQQDISGDVTANLIMDMENILADPLWSAQTEISELRPDVFFPDTPGLISGSLSGNGSLKHAKITSSLQIRDKNDGAMNWDGDLNMEADLEKLIFDIKNLVLFHPHTATRMTLAGTASMEQELDLLLTWHKLQWPITGDADYKSLQGQASIEGKADDFHLLLTAAVTGHQIPEGNITLNTQASTAGFQNLHLTLDLLDGKLDLRGNTEWVPMLKWDIHSEAKQINPGVEYANWPGRLDWLLQSSGKIDEKGVSAELIIEQLSGQLRELPIHGTGSLAMQPDSITIQNFTVSSGRATITAEGSLGEQSNLQWKVDIVDFSDLLPDASGQLKGSGSIQKAMTAPLLNIDLSGEKIHYSHFLLEQIDAKATVDLSWEDPFSLDIAAAKLQYKENQVKALSIHADGNREKHTILLKLDHEMADMNFTLNGVYSADTWQGLIENVTATSTDFGTWQSHKAATISVDSASASLDTFCLTRENADFCLKGAWDGESGSSQGDMQIDEIPLAWLAPWFPETLEGLTGHFSAEATASFHNTLKADVVAHITPGSIQYTTKTQAIELPHEGADLNLKIMDDALSADFLLSVDSNIIKATVQSPDLLQKDIGGDARLNAKIFMDAGKFDLIEALAPDVEDIDGSIDLNFTLLGTLANPEINGKGQINIAHMLIPMAGLDLADTTLDVLADGRELTLKGAFTSPGGEMELNGHIDLNRDQNKNMLARASLKADNFRLIHLPQTQVFLSSDILFEKKDGLMSLTGEASIPKADILLRELPPGSQSVSSDMVIIQEKKKEDPKAPFQMLLKITLGEDVHFAGFGLNAFVDGQLTLLSEPEEQIKGSGALHIKQGSFRAYGQDLAIETGVISFPGGPLSQPGINLRATRTVGDVVAGIFAIGPARKPRITTFSNPPMSESHVISYLLTGAAPDDAGKGAMLSIGRQINNKLSVAVDTDVKTGDSEFITRYRLNRNIHVETTTGSDRNAVDIFYTIELDDDGIKVPGLRK